MQTNTAEKIEPTGSLKSMLRAAPQKEAATSKSKTPVLQPDTETTALAVEVEELKKLIDASTTKLEQKSAELMLKISDYRAELCKRDYVSSLRIITAGGSSILVTWSANYKKIKPDKEDTLIKIFGDEKYQNYFKSIFSIKAKDDLTDKDLYRLFEFLGGGDSPEELQMGHDRFATFFEVDENIKPTENFVHDHVNMNKKTKEELDNAGVSQYRPSIKTR